MGFYMKFLVITALLLQPSTQAPSAEHCKQAADLLFLVDTSSSIWPKLYHRNVKGFLKNVIGKFHVGRGPQDTRVGVTLFSSGAYLQFHLNKYWTTEDVQAAVGRMPHRGGNTYTHLALRFAVDSMLTPQHGARQGMARLVVLITDGKSQYAKSTRKEAARLKATGTDVFVIGVGRAVDMKELKAMASKPSEKFVYKVTDFRALMRINERFIQTTCQVLRTTKTTGTPTTTTTTTTPIPTTTSTTAIQTTKTTTTIPTTATTTPTTQTTTTIPTTTTTTPTTQTTTTIRPAATTTPTTTITTTTTTTTTPTKTTTSKPTTTSTFSTTSTTPTTTTTTTPSTESTITTKNPTTANTTPEDFPIPEDLVKECKGKPADIYFLLDASYSVWINSFQDQVMPFVRKLSAAYGISPTKTQIGIVTYSDESFIFGPSKTLKIRSFLRSLQPETVAYYKSVSNIAGAISYVNKQRMGGGATRRGVPQLMIIVTGGLFQQPKATVKAAEEAKKQGFYMFSVRVGKYVDAQKLDDISSNPRKDFVFNVDNYNALTSITNLLAMKTCKAVAMFGDSSYYQDSLDCSAQSLNIMFLYEYMNSIPNSKKVRYHFINHFTHQLAQYAPNTKVGIMTQPCVGREVPLTSLDKFDDEMAVSRAKDQVGLSNLVKELRMVKFYCAPMTETRVAVLVLDEHTKNHDELKREVRKLRSQNVRIMVLAVGKVEEKLVEAVASSPLEKNTIRVDSYDDLNVKDINILKKLCTERDLLSKPLENVPFDYSDIVFSGRPV